ncbi:MAG: hypothetical protein HZB62_02495 [Nitrospirae bacterium]|nr:hypothetical protein [Nitrospirota bacterium]
MRRIVILFSVLLLFCASAYAGERSASGSVVLAERQAADVRVVMYMTSW